MKIELLLYIMCLNRYNQQRENFIIKKYEGNLNAWVRIATLEEKETMYDNSFLE